MNEATRGTPLRLDGKGMGTEENKHQQLGSSALNMVWKICSMGVALRICYGEKEKRNGLSDYAVNTGRTQSYTNSYQ